ncbi:MAG: PAS domain S-box protein [Pseudomonadota bacterium]
MPKEPGKDLCPRILICEDHVLLAVDMARILESLGYETAGMVSTGEEAVERAEKDKPDLILMDIKLAGEMDGIEAAARIRARVNIPVVFLSGYAEKDVVERAKITEPYGYLAKPVGFLELRSTVETALYRHKADQRVRESEERFRLVMQATDEGIWDWDVATGKTYYSPNCISLLGLEPGQSLDHFSAWLEAVHADDRERVRKVYDDCLSGKTDNFTIEFRIRHRDGAGRWILGRGKTVAADGEGRPLRIVGSYTDITDRKDTEDALRRSEDRHVGLVDHLPQRIFIKDRNSIYLSVNAVYAADLGMEPERVAGTDDSAFYPPESAEAYKDADQACMSSGIARHAEEPYTLGGRDRWRHTTRVPYRDGQGRVVGVLGVFDDITDRKRAEQALLADFSLMESLVQKAADGFAVCHNISEEPYVRFTHWNSRMEELTGYTIEEINRSGWYQCVYPDPEVRRRAEERMGRMRVGDDLRAEEWVITTKEGAERSLSISTSVVHQENERVHVLAIMRDVSYQKKMEQELLQAKQDWEKTFDAVPDLIMILDDRQRIVRLNRAAADAFGLSVEEAAGTFCFRSVHGVEERPALCPFDKLSDDISKHSEEVFIEKLGRTFLVTVSPIMDPGGGLKGCVHVAADITERKIQETALMEKARILGSLVEAMPDAVFLKDPDRRYVLVNNATEKLTGLSRNGTVGLMDDDLFDGAAAEQLRISDEEVLKSLEPNRIEELVVESCGRKTVLDVMTFPVFDDVGSFLGLGGAARDVTRLKEIEDGLRDREVFLNLLFESIQDGLNIGDTDFNILRANAAMERGWAHSMPLVGKKCYEAYHGRTEPCEICPVKETIETQAPARREIKWTMSGGRFGGWVDLYSFPLNDTRTGKLVGVVEYVRDITDKKKAEDSLRESEEKYRLMVENVRELVYVIQDGVIKFVNRYAMEISGYSDEEVLYQPFTKFVFPDDVDRVMDYHLRRTRGEDAPWRYNFRIVTADGGIIWLETNPVPITWEGRPGFVAFTTDITERKKSEERIKATLEDKMRVEEQLRESEQRFREIASLVPQFIYEMDLTGKFSFINEAAGDATGYTMDEFHGGVSFGDVFSPEDRERMSENMARILKGEKSSGNVYNCIRKDGTVFSILAYSSPVVAEGKIVGVRGVGVDITERKRAEDIIAASLKEKDVLLREIHHRVKNNLAVISSLLNLQAGYASDDNQRRMLEDAKSRIRSMVLAHEMLYQSENLADISAGDYVKRLSHHLVSQFGSVGHDINIRTEIDPGRLPLDTAIPIGFIITELLSNCFKHAFKGRDQGEITVSFRGVDDDTMELIVADNGIGLPEHPDLNNPQSLGFDLLAAFVAQLDGKMTIRINEGTLIRITFPKTGCRKKRRGK